MASRSVWNSFVDQYRQQQQLQHQQQLGTGRIQANCAPLPPHSSHPHSPSTPSSLSTPASPAISTLALQNSVQNLLHSGKSNSKVPSVSSSSPRLHPVPSPSPHVASPALAAVISAPRKVDRARSAADILFQSYSSQLNPANRVSEIERQLAEIELRQAVNGNAAPTSPSGSQVQHQSPRLPQLPSLTSIPNIARMKLIQGGSIDTASTSSIPHEQQHSLDNSALTSFSLLSTVPAGQQSSSFSSIHSSPVQGIAIPISSFSLNSSNLPQSNALSSLASSTLQLPSFTKVRAKSVDSVASDSSSKDLPRISPRPLSNSQTTELSDRQFNHHSSEYHNSDYVAIDAHILQRQSQISGTPSSSSSLTSTTIKITPDDSYASIDPSKLSDILSAPQTEHSSSTSPIFSSISSPSHSGSSSFVQSASISSTSTSPPVFGSLSVIRRQELGELSFLAEGVSCISYRSQYRPLLQLPSSVQGADAMMKLEASPPPSSSSPSPSSSSMSCGTEFLPPPTTLHRRTLSDSSCGSSNSNLLANLSSSISSSSAPSAIEVVVKRPKKSSNANTSTPPQQFWLEFLRELHLNACIPMHPRVLPLLGVCFDSSFDHTSSPDGANPRKSEFDVLLVSPFMRNGSLQQFLQLHRSRKLDSPSLLSASSSQSWPSFEQWLQLAKDLCEGVAHLHANRIVHRDIAPRNILLDSLGRAVICDFGLSRQLGGSDDEYLLLSSFSSSSSLPSPSTSHSPESLSPSSNSVPTQLSPRPPVSAHTPSASPVLLPVRWLAPECLRPPRGSFTAKSDVWAIGVTLWQLLTLREPFEGVDSLRVAIGLATHTLRLPLDFERCSANNQPSHLQQQQQHRQSGEDDFSHLCLTDDVIRVANRVAPVLQACFQNNPHDRPTVPQLLQMLEAL